VVVVVVVVVVVITATVTAEAVELAAAILYEWIFGLNELTVCTVKTKA